MNYQDILEQQLIHEFEKNPNGKWASLPVFCSHPDKDKPKSKIMLIFQNPGSSNRLEVEDMKTVFRKLRGDVRKRQVQIKILKEIHDKKWKKYSQISRKYMLWWLPSAIGHFFDFRRKKLGNKVEKILKPIAKVLSLQPGEFFKKYYVTEAWHWRGKVRNHSELLAYEIEKSGVKTVITFGGFAYGQVKKLLEQKKIRRNIKLIQLEFPNSRNFKKPKQKIQHF